LSPRRNKVSRRAAAPTSSEEELSTAGVQTVEFDRDGEEWIVRRITGSTSTKTYRCPGCDQEIRPATPHVVAWPSLAIDRRRHWHSPCWNARDRRGPR
jgi:hypothetical protein